MKLMKRGWLLALVVVASEAITNTTSSNELGRRQSPYPGYYPGYSNYYPGYNPGYNSGYNPGYNPGPVTGYTGRGPSKPRRKSRKKTTSWKWQRKPNGKWARAAIKKSRNSRKPSKSRKNKHKTKSRPKKVLTKVKKVVTNPNQAPKAVTIPNQAPKVIKPSQSESKLAPDALQQIITLPIPPPKPKIIYPVDCGPRQRNYKYPAWSFEEENDSGCEFSKLSLKRNFDVEMNKCSSYTKGQCTEWVDGRYFQLTGVHALFNGDANEWDRLALEKEGWIVSNTPTVPSIVVMKNFLENVAETGHVGIVESVNSDGSVCSSNWNFPTPMKIGMRNIKIRNGVSFIRYVGK